MARMKVLAARLRALWDGDRVRGEIEEEYRFHIELRTEENIERGMPPDEARREAERRFGRLSLIKEQGYDVRGGGWLEALGQDLRYGMRLLGKNPGFTFVAVLTLALGIGANTVVFSVAKAVLFRPLGFEAADQLVWIRPVNPDMGAGEERISWAEFVDVREAATSFDTLALFAAPGARWEEGDRAEELSALVVTPSLAEVLRIRPALGRMFVPSDAEPASDPVVLISSELWQTRFAGRSDILGQTLRVDEKIHTVVGVLPPRLEFPLGRALSAGIGSGMKTGVQDLWFPLSVTGEDKESRAARMFVAIGRLRPGASLAAARAELADLSRRVAAEYPETNPGWSLAATSFRDQVLGPTRQALHVLAIAVVAVLLICCVNLANLLLARGLSRQREVAVRLALGAGRGRVMRTLLTESVLLSILGGGLGIALAVGAVRAIRVLGHANVPFIQEAMVDGSVMGFTIALSLVTALVFGVFPALRQTQIAAAAALRSGTRSSAGPEIRAWQRGLLVGQIAVVLVLLASAGLLLESFRRVTSLDLGYQSDQVLVLELGTPDGVRLYREIIARIEALPGVEAVGTIHSAPLTGRWTFNENAQVFGRPLPTAEQPSLAATFVAFEYFQAMGIPLLSGRFFREAELREDEYAQVAILNETAATKLFPGETALGKRFAIGSSPERFYEVIGVVKDTRDVRLEEQAQPRFYLLFAHSSAAVVVRSSVPTRAMIPLVSDAVKQFGPRVIVREIKPMTEIVSATVAERRFLMAMIVTYAAVALGVATVGIFGVVAYQVAQRTNEFGIRLALGASPRSLIRLVLAQASRLVMLGLVIGLLLSFGATRLLESLLFDLSPHDPLLLGTVSVLLLGIGLLASWLPARRAARVDPIEALRYE
jgi:putative ABC transport system permease protein